MKVAFVTTYDAQDIRNWSGTPYYMSNALINAGIEVVFIGNLKSLSERNLPIRIRNIFYSKILKVQGRYNNSYEPRKLKYIARQVQEKLNKTDVDIIISPGAIPIAYLNSKKPIVLWTDATFAVLKNYYDSYSGLNKRTIRNCNLYEKNVLKRVRLAIFSSKWAADSSIIDYGTEPEKVKVIPYGANLACNRTVNDITEINFKKSRDTCRLLFIGQDWERKGGDTAVKIATELNNRNIKTVLTILGCTPPPSSNLPEYIHVLGFIDKSNKDGESLINKLYSESHFFVLPTIAECTPIVFSEANSFGLPIITTSTGGIGSIIRNDINGRMFGTEIDIHSCTNYISEIFKDNERYNDYSLSSFNEYLTTLNWNVSIKKLIGHLKDLLNN